MFIHICRANYGNIDFLDISFASPIVRRLDAMTVFARAAMFVIL